MSLQTINGKQIRAGVIQDKHISGKLTEKVLDIKWNDPQHAADILRNKVIVDYVQHVDPMEVMAGDSSTIVILSLSDSERVTPGVILNEPLRIRDINGEPIVSDGKEVICKLVNNEGQTGSGADAFRYLVRFTNHKGEEYIFESDTWIQFLYPIKTNLWDVMENFASNERFIDGGVDIRTKLDILQLAADVYGEEYEFNADGIGTQSETLSAILQRYAHGSTDETSEITSTAIIDEVYEARKEYSSLSERLENESNKGSKDLDDYKAKLASNKSKDGTFIIGHNNDKGIFGSDNLQSIIDEIGVLIEDANGDKNNLAERLAVSLKANGVLKDNEKIHTHGKFVVAIDSETSIISFENYNDVNSDNLSLIHGIDDVDVYCNGNLQAENIHYSVTKNEANVITGIDLTPSVIVDGDIITLKWTIYNKN